MIKLIFILGTAILSCSTTKKQATEKNDPVTTNTVVEQPAITIDTTLKPKNKPKPAANNAGAIPSCLKLKIDSFKVAQRHEQPQRVVEYQYKGKKVYYVVMPCCDFFNQVYDDKCTMIGSPDGGFTGKGDGRLPDFFQEAKNEKLIWEAKQ